MATMLLNSRAQEYGCFTQGRRVFGRTPKLPIKAAGGRFFDDFMISAAAPAAGARNLNSALFKIRQALLNADTQSKMGKALITRVRSAKTE